MKLHQVISYPLAFIYKTVVWVRNKMYDWGWIKTTSFKTPTLCIGNLSMGGTGKTPMAALLIEMLHSDYKIAVLTRGYGRKTKGLIHANPNSTASEIGDEPKQLLSTFPYIELVACEKRVEGMHYIESQLKVDLVILDDAFQHRKLTPKVAILLTTYNKLYCNDFYFPTGTLRDHKMAAHRAQVVVVTKSPKTLSLDQKKKVENCLKLKPDQKLFFSHLNYDYTLKGLHGSRSLHEVLKSPFCLVTGIADSSPIVEYLTKLGGNFTHKNYKDHQKYTSKEIDTIKRESIIVTTEKDFVKLQGSIDSLYYISVGHEIEEQELFENTLRALIKT